MAEKVLILGLSKSGIAAAKFAVSKGYDVYVTEKKNEVNLEQVKELQNLGIRVKEESK